MAEVETNPAEQVRYRRVPGLWRTGTLNRAALYTGGDHLLVCDYRTGFTERYKRFYFNDIQAIVIRKTAHWLGGIAIWSFFALIFFLIALGTHWNLFLKIMVGICLLFALRHVIRGPSCQTHVQTAVQRDALVMLKRVRKTNRVLRYLFPLIEQAQGGVVNIPSPNSSPAVPRMAPAPANVFAQTETSAPPPDTAPASVHYELSWLHVLTFSVVLLAGLTAIWEVNYPSTVSYLILVILFGLSLLGGIIALVRQARHRVHIGAAVMIWILVITFFIGAAGVDYAFTMAGYAQQARMKRPPTGPVTLKWVTPFQMRHLAGFDSVLWTFGIWAVLLSLAGLIFAFMPSPKRSQPPPLPGRQNS